jgi:hypothetical protein
MTEAEWLSCTDSNLLIRFVEMERKGTCRKLRLFGVACCRRLRRFLGDDRVWRVVEVAEGYADGRTDAAGLRAAHRRSDALCKKLGITPDTPRIVCVLSNAAVAANWLSASDASFRTNDRWNKASPGGYNAAAAGYIAGSTAAAVFWATYEGDDARVLLRKWVVEGASRPAEPIWAAEEEAQAVLLRCIIGNPFRPVTASPSWRSPQVVALAQAAYEQRELPAGTLDTARLAVLADALEEAGCTDADILNHLRGPGPHVRGCWAVDLLLGKG